MLRRLKEGESGQALLEFALILPMLLLLALGSIALIMGYQHKVAVTDMTRAAVRYMSLHCDSGSAAYVPNWRQEVDQILANGLNNRGLPFTGRVGASLGSNPQAGQIAVRADCSGGVATLAVDYASPNLFPPMAAVMGGQSGGRVFIVRSYSEYPVE